MTDRRDPDRSESDEPFMRLALRLAARAKGKTLPNPMVGAVVVRNGRIVGQGFHRRAGAPHAEVIALRQAGSAARGSTLYVTLEPCDHTGRTPPCARAIAAAGVSQVVAAMTDPDPRNRGRGFRRLRSCGIRTRVGVLAPEAQALNRGFIARVTRHRPFVTVKVAQSLDGKIATAAGESRWISGPPARRWARRLRAESEAILVGVETVLQDDPRLTVTVRRRAEGPASPSGLRRGLAPRPVRVILDSGLRTPPGARLFASRSPVWIAAARSAPRRREEALRRAGAEILRLPAAHGRVGFSALLRALARREVSRVLVEGGGEVIASAFEARSVDRIAWVVAPKILGGRAAVPSVGGRGVRRLQQAPLLEKWEWRRLGPDLLVTADVRFP